MVKTSEKKNKKTPLKAKKTEAFKKVKQESLIATDMTFNGAPQASDPGLNFRNPYFERVGVEILSNILKSSKDGTLLGYTSGRSWENMRNYKEACVLAATVDDLFHELGTKAFTSVIVERLMRRFGALELYEKDGDWVRANELEVKGMKPQ